jgi:hypothetical protein
MAQRLARRMSVETLESVEGAESAEGAEGVEEAESIATETHPERGERTVAKGAENAKRARLTKVNALTYSALQKVDLSENQKLRPPKQEFMWRVEYNVYLP